jgi:hypothetical protein
MPFTKSQTSTLESKICIQATRYARPSPAIAGISGVRSYFIWLLDLGSSQKKKETCTAQKIRKSQITFKT